MITVEISIFDPLLHKLSQKTFLLLEKRLIFLDGLEMFMIIQFVL